MQNVGIRQSVHSHSYRYQDSHLEQWRSQPWRQKRGRTWRIAWFLTVQYSMMTESKEWALWRTTFTKFITTFSATYVVGRYRGICDMLDGNDYLWREIWFPTWRFLNRILNDSAYESWYWSHAVRRKTPRSFGIFLTVVFTLHIHARTGWSFST